MQLKDFNTGDRCIRVTRKSWGNGNNIYIWSNRYTSHYIRDKQDLAIDAPHKLGLFLELTIDDMCADDWEEVTDV